ncbi:MAG: FtsW/RodA/SpoVE family cell cycle protein, partial [Chloroflexota bacterium]
MGTRIVSDPVGTINKPVVSQSSSSFFFTNGNVDFPLLLVMIAFVVFGLLMVFSASWDYSLWWYKDPMYQFNRQVVSMIFGIIGATFLSFVNYKTWKKYSLYAMILTIVFLFIVIFSHETGRGLKQGSYQPSELAKVMTIVYLAVWLHSKREQLHDVTWGLLPLGAILWLIGGLI